MKDLNDLLIGTVISKACKSNRKRKNLYELLNASSQGVRRLFGLAYVVAAGAANDEAGIKNNKKVFSPKRRDW